MKTFTVGAAVLASSLAWGTSQAGAFWGHGSSGGYGSWGSSGGSYGGYGYAGYGGNYGGWGSSGGSWGSSGGGYYGGHHHRHHHRRANYGNWGSSGGSWGSSGGSYGGYGYAGYGYGGSSGGWGSSGGSWGSSGGYVVGGGVVTSPAVPQNQVSPPPHPSDMPLDGSAAPGPGPGDDLNPPDDGAPAPPADNGAGLYRSSTSATLTVRVPADARVFVNGLATTSTGSLRRYVSNGLREGYSYTYQIRAEVVRGGETVTETQTVKLQAGDMPNVEFALNGSDSNPIANQPVNTSVTLHVPADAKVYLSGNETNSTGEVRTFSTTKLATGQLWGEYVVRVEVARNGRTLSKEEAITIKGGETRDLSFDFDAPQVARVEK